MILIISTSNNNIQHIGEFFWGSKFFPSIKPYLPESIIDVIAITEGIIYFNKAENKNLPVLSFKVISSALTNNYFKVKYNIDKNLEFKSYQIRNALKKYLNKDSVLELPFCCAVDETSFYNLLENSSLKSQIDFLQEKNNWTEIYRLLENHQPLEQNQIWNDAEILNKFSFAVAKLSECSENLKKKFSNKEELKKYVEEKRNYRKLCIKLRERCIELQPNNASFYANLAYVYYQSVNELSTPGGRRDGNVKSEAQKAIELLNKSLEIQPERITELYRRAYLKFEVLSNLTLYNQQDDKPLEEKIKSVIELRNLAESDFKSIIDIFENSISEDDKKLNTKKYYIKSLYQLALINLQKGKIKFDLAFFINNSDSIFNKLDTEQINSKIHYLEIADDYISKCIIEDNYKTQLEEIIEAGTTNNFAIGVYKLYLKGLIQFYLYLLTNKTKHNLLAKEFLYKANETNFPKEMQKQNKLFILEKIASLKIVEKSPKDAISLLEPHYKRNKFFPDYAAYTLLVAYIQNSNFKAAEELLNEYTKDEKSNLFKKFINLKEKYFHLNKEIMIKTFDKIFSNN